MPLSEFAQNLVKNSETKDCMSSFNRACSEIEHPCMDCLQYIVVVADVTAFSSLKRLTPSQVDVEVRSLAPSSGGSVALCVQFLAMIHATLDSNRDFELAQAYFALFLKVTFTK